MYRLVVCKPDAAEWFDLEPGASAAGRLALSWNEESVVVEGVGRVSWNQPARHRETTVFIKPLENYAMKRIGAKFTLGRTDFQQPDPHLSGIHFTIVNDRLVDQSTNGTYVNGARVKEADLHAGDTILAATTVLYYYPPFLFSDTPWRDEPWPEEPEEETGALAPRCLIERCKIPVFDALEPFVSMPSAARSSLAGALAPSFMMLSSTGISLWIQARIAPERFGNFLLMSMSSLFMSFAFLMLGLFQFFHGRRQNRAQILEAKTLYMDYVRERLDDYAQAVRRYTLAFDDASKQERCLCPPDLIPIEIERVPVALPAMPAVNYATRKSALYTEVQNEIAKHQKSAPVWRPLARQAAIWIRCAPMDLFCHMAARADEKSKWVWICAPGTLPRLHGLCVEERILRFDDVEQALAAIGTKTMYWIVVEKETLPVKPLRLPDNASLICCAEHMPSYPFDQTVEQPSLLRHPLPRQGCPALVSVHDIFDLERGVAQARGGQKDFRFVIGVNEGGLVTLDLLGAHLLVAGMTGSGKSEFLAALLLYGVVYFSSQDFQYLLIDFKGGAFGSAFYAFPHCAGQITNLEGDQIERFMASLRCEIKRRQTILASFQKQSGQVADIAWYRAQGHAMSHVLIVVDEFAQLKLQYPHVMDDLKEMARIGRSLGIHLVLATQKPAGVVDEQIWSNSKYRICLKVNSASDSREVLSHDKAATIEEPGTFYMQESEKDEVIGRSFYVQAGVRRWHVEGVRDGADSILNAMKKNVLALAETGAPIVQPPLDSVAFDSLWLVDKPCEQKLEVYDIPLGERVAVWAGRHWRAVVESIQARYDPVYVEHLHFEQSSLWFLQAIEEPVTVVIDFDAAWLDKVAWLEKPNIRLICLFSQTHSRFEPFLAASACRIGCDFSNPEAVRQFFNDFIHDTRKDFPMALLSIQNEYFTARWRVPSAPSPSRLAPLPCMDGRFSLNEAQNYFSEPVLGYDARFLPIFWTKKRKLLVCYRESGRQEDLFYLMQVWRHNDPFLRVAVGSVKENADILILDVEKDKSLFQDATFQARLYDFDVMWVGEGFNDYAFLLKKRLVHTEGEVIVFQEGGVQTGRLLEIYA
ncbi:FtsK/SpoIIIE domain-containing protein [uncultured Dubosiella sp.]|uniref:FHA domain-containing protein n=1 Tax=uncultured Dubosiella sp. TaxID=1937011 RepID=UPI0025B51055|nr:FtsK/SpoIIIE domain-containing protein [uncultured Dubosiella sp.]